MLQHESNNMGRDFRLAVIYPRRVFTNADHQTSLRDLNLCPTSALLVLPPVRCAHNKLLFGPPLIPMCAHAQVTYVSYLRVEN